MFLHTELREKKVIVVGGSRGLGRFIAEEYLKSGGQVIIFDREVPEETIRDMVKFVQIDLEGICRDRRLPEEVLELLSSADILINNVRGERGNSFLNETADSVMKAVNVGMTAPLLISQIFISLSAHPASEKSIVNISSIASQRVGEESAGYHATKGGVESITRYLAVHAGPMGIRVNAVAPGFIVQPEHLKRFYSEGNIEYRDVAERCHPVGRVGTASDVTDVVLFLSSSRAGFVTGQTIVIDGGLGLRDGWAQANQIRES